MALFISAGPSSYLTSNYNVCTVFSCEYIVLDIGKRKYLSMTAHHPVYRRETVTLNKEHIAGRWRGKLYWFWRFPLKETPGSQCTLRQELQYLKHAFLACAFCQARSEKEAPFFSSVWAACGFALVTQKGACLSGRIGHISFCFRIKPHFSPLFCLTQSKWRVHGVDGGGAEPSAEGIEGPLHKQYIQNSVISKYFISLCLTAINLTAFKNLLRHFEEINLHKIPGSHFPVNLSCAYTLLTYSFLLAKRK